MMADGESKIRVKIIAGYLLVTAFTLVAGWWIYANIFNAVTTDEAEYSRIYEKSTLTSSVISYIYQVDYYGNRFTQSYSTKSFNEYRDALKVLYSGIDSLKTKITSPHQIELIDNLVVLMGEKNRNTLALVKIRVAAGRDNAYERSIEDIIKNTSQDSVERVVVKSTMRNDTLKSPPPVKRSFFQRLGDAFVPKRVEKDSMLIVSSVNRDTLRTKQSPSDSLVVALEKAKQNISTSQLKIRNTVSSKLQDLVVTEQQISIQISLIITELSQEATQNIIDEIKSKRAALSNSGRLIGVVAGIAVLMIVLFLFFILKDVSRSARYKRELEQARTRAEELMRSRHRMLLNISHDIKAPLCSITGYLDLMGDSADADVRKWAESMKISSGYIMDLLANLLEYARLETGKSVVHISTFDMDRVVDDIVRIFTPIASDKGLYIKSNRTEAVGFISSDAIRIRQIVMNLVSNAVKFTDEGGIEVSYAMDGDVLVLSVRDSGRGIAKSKIDSIFDEFTREQSVEGIEGSGLGLAVVRGAVSLLGGGISVESRVGQGSLFNASIPVCRAEASGESTPQVCSPLTILAVDDDALQLRMMSEMMSRSTHTLHCASKLKDVERIVSTHKIDLILTDLQMGSFSGYKLLQHIRAKGYNMPIVAVSASDHVDTADLKKAGFSDFLRKPFTLSQLNSLIVRSVPQSIISELVDGDDEMAREIMELFEAATAENVKLLKEYLHDNRMDDARKLCHKMLPMFLQLQITDVATLLKEVDVGDFDAAKIERIIEMIK